MPKYLKLDPPVNVGGTLIPLLELNQYQNGRIAIRALSLLAPDDGGDGKAMEPYGDLAVNLPDQDLPPGDTFFARNYSYHAQTHDAMIAAGIIEEIPGYKGQVGMHGFCTVARLTNKAIPVEFDGNGNLVNLTPR
jgi:hypothetical protein